MECEHEKIVIEGQNQVCVGCGMTMERDINYNKEWRYYGSSDTRHNGDPNRCNMRKPEEKTIMKDIEKLGFTDKIVQQANCIYQQTTQGHIFRGNTRKGIIFACVYHACKLNNTPQSCEQLMDIFQLDRKIALKGIKFINLHIAKESPLRHISIDTEHLIIEIMNKFYASEDHMKEVLEIYHKIKDSTSLLKRSRPHSVASGIVRYYIMQKNTSISMEFFKNKVQLSEMTIVRIVKEISKLLDEK